MKKHFLSKLTLILFILSFGVGGFIFYHAHGFSYLSDTPEMCINCHVMQKEYDSWHKSTHQGSADCSACHLPQETVPKYIEKAKSGLKHTTALMLKNYSDPIRIHEGSKKIVLTNCFRCHAEGLSKSPTHAVVDKSTDCAMCHAKAGH